MQRIFSLDVLILLGTQTTRIGTTCNAGLSFALSLLDFGLWTLDFGLCSNTAHISHDRKDITCSSHDREEQVAPKRAANLQKRRQVPSLVIYSVYKALLLNCFSISLIDNCTNFLALVVHFETQFPDLHV
jgi:hypothetical protein